MTVAPAQWSLTLEDGSIHAGIAFGAREMVVGEVVFNTAMAGYVESLTDPSYRGQILVLTYPLIGNYGVPAPRKPGSIEGPYESDRVQALGLVVQGYTRHFSHSTAVRSLGDWLADEGVPGLTGIDTRALTRRLRQHGVMRGWIGPTDLPSTETMRRARSVDMRAQVFHDVAPAARVDYAGGPLRVLLVDCGAKDQIVRSLLERGASVARVPWFEDLAAHAAGVDAILIGNGPGDPAHLESLAAAVRDLLGRFHGPIFGLCLGHQILAHAAGGTTYKLPYGHRGINQPVRNELSGKCFVTSQNHGYAVDDHRLPHGWRPWFTNLNDATNEGLRALDRPHLSVQFHPEAGPGPRDTGMLFDEFLTLAAGLRRSR
jgi:carbamoyl-phosphate synthase small subunit